MIDSPAPHVTGSGRLLDEEHPWPGLASFRERDQAFFRGREQEIEELRRTVRLQRLTVLFGASGLGKTSLLHAGLFPALRTSDELPVYIRLDLGGEARALTEQVFSEIMSAATASRAEAPPRRGEETLWEYFHRREAAFWSERNRLLLPVLVFDQFEEVFSRGLERPEWIPFVRSFLDALADLVEGRPPERLKQKIERDPDAASLYDFVHHRYRVILSLREDFLAPLEQLRSSMPSIGSGRYRLLPMTGEQAFKVVDQTKGRLVEAQVARKIVRFAAGRPVDDEERALAELQIDPSLLGLFCCELNELRLAARAPTISEALVRQNQGNIVESFYEGCMRMVDPALRRFVEDELVTGRGHRDSRAAEDALARAGITADDLSKLVSARLLRIEDRGGTRRIELTHDVLTGVVRAARDRRHAEERIEADRAAERERLEEEKRAAERERLEREAQLARVEAQRAREAERSSRRFRRLAGALAAALVAAIGMAWWAYDRSQHAAEQSRLAAETAEQERLAYAALYNLLRVHEKTVHEIDSASRALEDLTRPLGSAPGDAGKPRAAAPSKVAPPGVAAQPAFGFAIDLGAALPGKEAAQRLETAEQALQQAATLNIQKLQDCATKPRVYVHIAADGDRGPAKPLVARLEREGFVVPGIERRPEVPRASEVRYFRKAEADGAAIITATLRRHDVQNAVTRYVPGYETSTRIRACHYEIWFSADAFPATGR